jgi:hypothetical protein
VTNYFSRISQKVSYEVEKVSYEVEKVSYEVQKVSYRKMIFWNQFSGFAQYEKLSSRGCKCNSTSGPQKLSYMYVQENWVTNYFFQDFSKVSYEVEKVSYEVEKVSYEVEKVSYEVEKVSYRKMISWNQF